MLCAVIELGQSAPLARQTRVDWLERSRRRGALLAPPELRSPFIRP
ncbi:hypothetical protein [Streptomyces coeruleorubidus]|jgi:hypothetical protein